MKYPGKSEYQQAVDANRDCWVPACGGLEIPYMNRYRKRVLYVYNPKRRMHGYLDMETDLVSHDEVS